MKSNTEDTIAAIATPPGRSALGLIRISGKDCRNLVPEIFVPRRKGDLQIARPILGQLILGEGQFVDEALVTFFQAPNSYTREDLAEISCHGNPLILEKVLLRIVGAGARLALPGEFTFRAFLNGRLDLVQAEAVRDLIDADSLHQVDMALHQLDGRLSRRLAELRSRIKELMALLEGNIDFSEEQHYEFTNQQDVVRRLHELSALLRELLGTFERGRMIREGYNVAIIGRPNVGKSSLFNILLGQDRAIVAATPGTTRDFLRERIRLGSFIVNLLDTAGIRKAVEDVEAEGIRRSRQVIEKAELIVLILDGSQPLLPEDQELLESVRGRDVIVVSNKSDLQNHKMHSFDGRESLAISAITGAGLDDLVGSIKTRVQEQTQVAREDSIISTIRHRDLLTVAADSVDRSRAAAIDGLTEEFVVADLHAALQAVGEITGEVTVDEIYQHIFSNFCIGK